MPSASARGRQTACPSRRFQPGPEKSIGGCSGSDRQQQIASAASAATIRHAARANAAGGGRGGTVVTISPAE